MPSLDFASRHIGADEEEKVQMLKQIGVRSMEQLIDETIPSSIRTRQKLNIPDAQSEFIYLNELYEVSRMNKVFKSYIGLGYSHCIVPGVVRRNVLENPEIGRAHV